MNQLLIGTTNPAKFEEAAGVFKAPDLKILSLRDFPDIQQVPECGSTFFENAFLKAAGYYWQTSIPCIADDGGLLVDALKGLPGVHSHRWLGHEATDEELAGAVLERMKGVPQEKRTARLGGVVTFYSGAQFLKAENYIEGYIGGQILDTIKPGFPYRPILVIPQFGKPYSALTDEEHEQVNFRRRSLNMLKPEILKLLSI